VFADHEWSLANNLARFVWRLQGDDNKVPVLPSLRAFDIHVNETASLSPNSVRLLTQLLESRPLLHVTVWCPRHEANALVSRARSASCTRACDWSSMKSMYHACNGW